MHTEIQQIGELSTDGVFIYNIAQVRFIYINDAFARIFDLDKDTLISQSRLVLPLINTEDDYYLRHNFSILLRDKKISNVEFRLELKDSSMRHLRCDAYLLQDSSVVAGFLKDVTLEKEHEDYIINYGAKKDTLLDMMSHNLTGPLALSKDILKWIQASYKTNTPEQISSNLLMIQDNTQHCLDIVNDFLKEEHMESERIYIKKTRFDVLERIIATLDKLIAANRNKKFRLITKLENLNITTDSVKFFQVIHNLVSNSIKFTPDMGEIDIHVEEAETTFIIRVKDNGIGIPVALQANIFDKRTIARREGMDNELSNGLGLSIVKILVELLGGRVWFETEENKGSVFSIELPKD